MRVQIRREGLDGRLPPTTFCQLEEVKIYGDGTHIDTDWYIESYNVGDLLLKIQAHEDSFISFKRYNYDGSYIIIIEND